MMSHLPSLLTPDRLWLGIGFLGQALFASRFLVQWFRSEVEGRSVIPLAFWYFSLIGGLVTLIYTVHLQSAPLILGQASGLIVYCRNLFLIFRERVALRRAAEAS